MIESNPNGIDGIKSLMILGGAIATLELIWLINLNILRAI
jgi:hypothetical protein